MLNFASIPNRKYLEECFYLDEKSGSIFWKKRPESHFNSRHGHSIWVSQNAGKQAGTKMANGYISIRLNGIRLMAHRVAFSLAHHEIPDGVEIDHIDGNRSNNAASNLRYATSSQNKSNIFGAKKNSKSGIRGVCWHSLANKWRAQVRVRKKTIHLGLFENIQDAEFAAKAAREKYFGEFSERHQIKPKRIALAMPENSAFVAESAREVR